MIHAKTHVLVSDRFDDEAFARLSASSTLKVSKSLTPDLSGDDLDSVHALVIRSRTRITRELLARLPVIQTVITSTSGYDHIDLKDCRERGVKVMFTPTANAASACELTWALLLAAARKLPEAQACVAQANWQREKLMGFQFSGKTYGIIGLGRIGSRVAKVAQAFGLKTLSYDPYRDDAYFANAGCERAKTLSDLIGSSDVLSLHVPATDETREMITLDLLKSVRPDGLIFANTSRGTVIAESALIQALDKGLIRACGLDVYEHEPLPASSPLIGRPNVVLSPHIGATTHAAFKAASLEAADKIIAFAERGIVSDFLP